MSLNLNAWPEYERDDVTRVVARTLAWSPRRTAQEVADALLVAYEAEELDLQELMHIEAEVFLARTQALLGV